MQWLQSLSCSGYSLSHAVATVSVMQRLQSLSGYPPERLQSQSCSVSSMTLRLPACLSCLELTRAQRLFHEGSPTPPRMDADSSCSVSFMTLRVFHVSSTASLSQRLSHSVSLSQRLSHSVSLSASLSQRLSQRLFHEGTPSGPRRRRLRPSGSSAAVPQGGTRCASEPCGPAAAVPLCRRGGHAVQSIAVCSLLQSNAIAVYCSPMLCRRARWQPSGTGATGPPLGPCVRTKPSSMRRAPLGSPSTALLGEDE
jgi:hypothetical protein